MKREKKLSGGLVPHRKILCIGVGTPFETPFAIINGTCTHAHTVSYDKRNKHNFQFIKIQFKLNAENEPTCFYGFHRNPNRIKSCTHTVCSMTIYTLNVRIIFGN